MIRNSYKKWSLFEMYNIERLKTTYKKQDILLVFKRNA